MAESSSISRTCLRSSGLSVRECGGGDGIIPDVCPSFDGVRGAGDGRGVELQRVHRTHTNSFLINIIKINGDPLRSS